MPTSRLQKRVSQLLSIHLGQYTIRENTRPEWLGGLELDFYVEELGIAIEVQGAQHYRYIPHFHLTPDGFQDQLGRDATKRDMCRARGLTLYDVATEDEAIDAIEKTTCIQVPYKPHPNYVAHAVALQDQAATKKPAKKLERSMRRKRYRERRGARLVEKDQEAIGTRNSRNSGRKKTTKAFGNSLYLVWGGEDQHIVWYKRYKDPKAHIEDQHIVWYKKYEDPEVHICECRDWARAKNHVCSHVFAVALFLSEAT